MQQPGAASALSSIPAVAAPTITPATAQPSAFVKAAGAVDSNIETLLASVMNWQPTGFFSSSAAPSAQSAHSPLMLSHGVLDMLSSARDL